MLLCAELLCIQTKLGKADFEFPHFLKKKHAFWKIHPESPFGHSFGAAFVGLCISVTHCYPRPHPCHNHHLLLRL